MNLENDSIIHAPTTSSLILEEFAKYGSGRVVAFGAR